MNPTDDLYYLGFREVGQWSLDKSLKSGILFILTSCSDDRVIYAFTVDDCLKYIGVCEKTATTLCDRMSRYKGMAGARTNQRVGGSLVKILASNPTKASKLVTWKWIWLRDLRTRLSGSLNRNGTYTAKKPL